MAKYLKESGSAEAKLLYVVSADAEVDDWHPASNPPKPEDFEPMGRVQTIWWHKNHWVIADVCRAESFHGIVCDYWRKITPPK